MGRHILLTSISSSHSLSHHAPWVLWGEKKKSGSFSSASKSTHNFTWHIVASFSLPTLYIVLCYFSTLAQRDFTFKNLLLLSQLATGELTIKMESSTISFLYALILHSQFISIFHRNWTLWGRIRDILSSLSNCSKDVLHWQAQWRNRTRGSFHLQRYYSVSLVWYFSVVFLQWYSSLFVILRRTILYFLFWLCNNPHFFHGHVGELFLFRLRLYIPIVPPRLYSEWFMYRVIVLPAALSESQRRAFSPLSIMNSDCDSSYIQSRGNGKKCKMKAISRVDSFYYVFTVLREPSRDISTIAEQFQLLCVFFCWLDTLQQPPSFPPSLLFRSTRH